MSGIGLFSHFLVSINDLLSNFLLSSSFVVDKKSHFIIPPGHHPFVTSTSFFYFQCAQADLAGDKGIFYGDNIYPNNI